MKHKVKTVLFIGLALVALFGMTACPNNAGGNGGGTPPVTKYKVELDHTIGGNVKVTPALSENGMVAENTELTFTAEPLQGYDLEKWELNGTAVNGTKPTYTLKVTANAQVKVSFKRNSEPLSMRSVTITAPQHGRVRSMPEIPSDNQVPEGSTIILTAVPDEGYAVNTWSVTPEGDLAAGGNAGSSTATLRVSNDVTVTVTFKQVLCKIDFGVDGTGGTLTAKVDGTEIHSGDMVKKNKTVVFTANPASGCEVEQWTNNGTPIAAAGTNTSYNHTVSANANIKVKFKYSGPALTVDTTAFTKTAGDSFTHRFVMSGSGSYTAEAETPNILYLNLYNLSSQGKIWVRCEQVGSTRIKITDKVSGQTAFSGLITVKPDEDYFEEGGMRYRITDKTAREVSVTAETAHYIYEPYTVPSLTIPKEVTHGGVTYTVTGIERPNLWGTTLQSVTVASDNAYLLAENGVIFNKDKTVLLGYLPGKPDVFYIVPASVIRLGESSFSNVPALTSLTLPNGLKTIEDKALWNCENLVVLNLPSSLKSIGWRSLGFIKVSSMVVPENITQLWDLFLSRCPELTSVELPSTLTEMRGDVLADDPKLKTVTCKALNPPTITAAVFKNTPIASATLRVPAGSKALYQAAEGWKDFGTIVGF
ncbi:leucine-rich repeat domain-containing protein [Treponema denticola]|uniref:Leucine-rich repeat domain-containing protein n=1 Tax=Treponema denticola TaxID=158 RepID=A0A9Q9EWJ4_TREDN|nr:leucine-rich repeat protein [Treponema denticola]UTC91201.1 leucine-rich repeat domain-containing protein [Treponema denticola]UTC99446.1 leucine-rich repeat domain-containing protein [Treponema denticola]